jgi:hypothetical protein
LIFPESIEGTTKKANTPSFISSPLDAVKRLEVTLHLSHPPGVACYQNVKSLQSGYSIGARFYATHRRKVAF